MRILNSMWVLSRTRKCISKGEACCYGRLTVPFLLLLVPEDRMRYAYATIHSASYLNFRIWWILSNKSDAVESASQDSREETREHDQIDEMSISIISIYRMLHNLHHAPDNLSFARLVMHNPASKGSKCDSPFNAKLPSPKHVWSGSCQLRNREEYLNTILHVWRILRSEDVEYEIRDKYDLIQDRCNWQRQESKMRSGW